MRLVNVALLTLLCTWGCNSAGGIGCITLCNPAIQYPQPGACPLKDGVKRQPGGACDGTPLQSACVAGAQCISGTCVPCGTNGLTCCDTNGCIDGSTCSHNKNKFDICDNSCGKLGGACCGPMSGCLNGVCTVVSSNQVCVAGSACSGLYTYGVPLIEKQSRCASYYFHVNSTSVASAITCAQSMLDGQQVSSQFEVGPINVEATYYPYCVCGNVLQGCNSIYEPAYSQADGDTCISAKYQPGSNITSGMCP